MKKSIVVIIALMFSFAMNAQKGSTVQQVATKVFTGTITGIKTENGSTFLMLQVAPSTPSTTATTKQKLKLAFAPDGVTLNINTEAKDLLVSTAAAPKLNSKYMNKNVKATCTLIGTDYVINTLQ